MLKTIGLQFRKVDILNFIFGVFSAIILLLLVYLVVKPNMKLANSSIFSLFMVSKKKLIYYFMVGLLEELLFRGLILGLVLKKVKNVYVKIIASALIFSVPHIFNTDNIDIIVMFIFPLLYGIVSSEMLLFTKSIWMSTGFHWLWNYIIASIFLATGNINLVYVWIIIEMLLLIPILYYSFNKLGLSLNNLDKV